MAGKRKPEGPDSARSWAIAAAACVINTLLSGISRATGLFYVALIETYGVSRLQANLPFTMRNAIRNLLGPLVGAIGQRYGPRDVTIVGGIFASLGIILCTFAPNVIWITILWGGMHGLGVALGNTLFQVIVTQYFEKYRATASGLALSGACLGSFVFPILTEYMLDTLGLAGSFLVTGGLVLHVLPAAIMLKEPPWIQRDIKEKEKVEAKKQLSNVSTVSKKISKSTHSMSIIQEDETSTDSQNVSVVKRSSSSNSSAYHEDKDKESNSRDANNMTYGIDNPSYAGSSLELNKKKSDQNRDEVVPRERLRTISIGEVSLTIKSPPPEHQQETSIYKGTMKLFRDPMFHMISLSLAAFAMLFDPALTVIVDYLMDKGVTEEIAKYFISILSVGDLLGRLCFGWVTDRNYMSVSNFMMVIQIMQGLCFLAMPLFNGFDTLMAIMVIYGVMSGANLVMYPILVGKYLQSVQSLAIGFIAFFSGLLSFAVPPLIGYFRDEVGSYDGMFYITGGLSAATGCFWLLEPLLLKLREKLQKNDPVLVISL
ncbi:Monocarboxylate transporter 9 like protein [Argiope bruennichi]|uniref:Monocarboxylate transporter 9 like protein n=1 Tax=Argiope bruennichi TaxID=94029 RepID=A0A8T0F0Y9_ARGBR|nr:Monocarboxylate transporter 9 like protein [Argiope bruennichi]